MADVQLKSDALLEQMKLHLATDAGKEIVKKIGLVYQINIAPKKIGFNEVTYVVDLKKGEVKKGAYEGGKPDATFSFKDDDFLKVATGKMNPQIAFMRGAMKIKGSLSAAQKFTPDIFPKPSKIYYCFRQVSIRPRLSPETKVDSIRNEEEEDKIVSINLSS